MVALAHSTRGSLRSRMVSSLWFRHRLVGGRTNADATVMGFSLASNAGVAPATGIRPPEANAPIAAIAVNTTTPMDATQRRVARETPHLRSRSDALSDRTRLLLRSGRGCCGRSLG